MEKDEPLTDLNFFSVGKDDEFDFCDKNFSIFKGKRKKKNHLTV